VVAPFREERVMVVAEVVGGIVLLVGALLAVDWFTAGRAKGRRLVRAKDQSSGKAGIGYASIERTTQSQQNQNGGGGTI
jgi:hypothetical protein